MALVECYECGREISDAAPACIHCGAPAKKAAEASTENWDLPEDLEKPSIADPKPATHKSFLVLAETYLYKFAGWLLNFIWDLFNIYLRCWGKKPGWTLILTLLVATVFIGYLNQSTSTGASQPAYATQKPPAPAPAPVPVAAPAPKNDATPPAVMSAQTKPVKDEAEVRKERYAAGIPDYVLTPYRPGLFKKFSSRRSEIEKFRRLSAERAIDSGKCDSVEVVELSQVKSTLNDLHFFVDCTNTQRITFSERELKENSAVKTAEERSWDCTEATKVCADSIRSGVDMPSRLDLHTIMGSSCSKAPLTFNVRVDYDFGYKNDYGVQDEFTATCYFQPGESSGSIEVSPKR